MKTPEEIKKALECCAGDAPCEDCPYFNNNDAKCGHNKNREALAYIHYLEEGAEVVMGRVRELEADHRTEYCDNFFGECVELGKARKRIAELEAQVAKDINVPRWISVEERLPTKKGLYPAYLSSGYVRELWFDGEEFPLYNNVVTCWMDTSEPPKEG